MQHLRRQRQQPERIRYGWAGLPDPLRRLVLRETVLLHQRPIALCFFHRIQVLALEVFHKRQLGSQLVVGLNNARRYLSQARKPCRPPAALAGDELIVAGVQFSHGNGLYDAVFAYRFGQL